MKLNKKRKDIGFVVLHYNVIDETKNCVNSIISNIDTKDYFIVVVDNCSPNGSGKIIQDFFKNNDRVSVVLSKENAGFAKGNNIGIDFLRSNFDIKYIVCLNNDTLLEQKNFLQNIDDIYNSGEYAVIGPKIILKDNTIQEFTHKLFDVEKYEEQLKHFEQLKENDYIESKKNAIKRKLLEYKLIRKLNFYRHGIDSKSYFTSIQENVVLQGSCLIFTPIFFSCLEGFCPDTFLYYEEQILFVDLLNNGLKNVYAPKIEIKHLEGRASSTLLNVKKRQHFVDNSIISLKILISKMR